MTNTLAHFWDRYDIRHASERPVEPLRHQYRVVCLICGRDGWHAWTDAEVHHLPPQPVCATCGGMRVVEQDYGQRMPTPVMGREQEPIGEMDAPTRTTGGVWWSAA